MLYHRIPLPFQSSNKLVKINQWLQSVFSLIFFFIYFFILLFNRFNVLRVCSKKKLNRKVKREWWKMGVKLFNKTATIVNVRGCWLQQIKYWWQYWVILENRKKYDTRKWWNINKRVFYLEMPDTQKWSHRNPSF